MLPAAHDWLAVQRWLLPPCVPDAQRVRVAVVGRAALSPQHNTCGAPKRACNEVQRVAHAPRRLVGALAAAISASQPERSAGAAEATGGGGKPDHAKAQTGTSGRPPQLGARTGFALSHTAAMPQFQRSHTAAMPATPLRTQAVGTAFREPAVGPARDVDYDAAGRSHGDLRGAAERRLLQGVRFCS